MLHDHYVREYERLYMLSLEKHVIRCTYCDRSSIRVCKLLFSTQDKLRSAHRLQGGPLSSMRHLICAIVIMGHKNVGDTIQTFCFRHDAHAFTLRDTTGIVVSTYALCILGREAGGAESAPFSTWSQARFGGMTGTIPCHPKSRAVDNKIGVRMRPECEHLLVIRADIGARCMLSQ